MTVRRFASICLLIFVNLLAGFFYLQSERLIPVSNNNENETFVWNTTDSVLHLQDNVSSSKDKSHNERYLYPFHYIINQKNLCTKNSENKEKLSLVILVCSAVQNLENRQAIRETWGSVASSLNNTGSVRIAFLLGATNNTTLQETVNKESHLNWDIIQESFYDSYQNLTLKSIMLLKWVTEHCVNVHYVLKTDDDMYVNVAKLVNTLSKLSLKSKVMYGTLFRKAKPNRTPAAKWYVPKEQFQGDEFPDYLSGTGYVISRDVVPALFEVSSTLPFLVMEDVFITGLCASQAGVHRYNIRGFAHWKRSVTGCAFRDAITGHHVSIKDMRKIWSELQKKNLLCRAPKKG